MLDFLPSYVYTFYCRVDVAEWQTRMVEGHVGDREGSSPSIHTIFFYKKEWQYQFAGVAELADARDSKSRDRNIVWVRPPSPVPLFNSNR